MVIELSSEAMLSSGGVKTFQSGRNAPESVAGLNRNGWPGCVGIGGRHAPENPHNLAGRALRKSEGLRISRCAR